MYLIISCNTFSSVHTSVRRCSMFAMLVCSTKLFKFFMFPLLNYSKVFCSHRWFIGLCTGLIVN